MDTPHNNSFDLIRHIAALAVLFSHHYALSGLVQPGLGGPHTLGTLAVLAFFSISGYLITLSFLRSDSFYSYLIKRIARIFPALIFCSLLMVYLAAPIFSEKGAARLIDPYSIFEFLRISAMGQAHLPDVTHNFISGDSFNGSLWTLKIEFACYLAIAALLSFVHRATLPLGAAFLIGFLTWYFDRYGQGMIASKLAIYGSAASAFFLGSFCAFKRHWLAKRKILVAMIFSGIALFVLSKISSFTLTLGSFGVCLVTLGIGLLVRDPLIKSRFDISYGIYLYAYPTQQILINCTELDFYQSLLATTLVVLCIATLSWLTIEKPALRYAHNMHKKKPKKTQQYEPS
jgi:peptidoglycan/LPS O-acetylase OafA/YrhL